MKTKLKNALLLTFFALLALTSCQNEITEITQPNEEQVIVAKSSLASLMRSTSTNNGTVDDIMDNADCMSVNLPVTIVVNSITITINTEDDLELIQDIFEEYIDDEDNIEFLFPITIVLNDYTEVVIENEEQLAQFIERCDDIDEPIECVDFKYPISFAIFNSEFQIIDNVVIENDEELYDFLDRIEDADEAILASLNFPVKMIFANGEMVEVHNNQELERVMNEAEEMCDDDGCDIDEVDEYLLECKWKIHYYNEDDNFRPYDVFFLENGELNIVSENATAAITGNWSTRETDEGVVLTISELTQFDEDLSGDWLIKECDDDRFKLIRINTAAGTPQTRIILKQRCEDEPDCSPQEIRENLQDCFWYAGSNLFDNNQYPKFQFNDDGTVLVFDDSVAGGVSGTWEVALTDYGIKIILDLPEPYNMLSRYWKVYECDDDRIKVINEDYYIVFEKDCVNPFECFSGREFGICDDGNEFDGLATFNLEEIYSDCPQDHVEVTFHTTQSDAANGTEPLSSTFTNTTNSQTIYARVVLAGNPNEYEVYSIALFVEDCNAACSEEDVDGYLVEANCHWVPVSINNSDDFNSYDFYFDANLNLKMIDANGGETFGTWSTSEGNGEGVIVTISQIDGTLQQFNGEWLVAECGAERMVLTYNGVELVLERECS